jgi:transcriptional regulator with XRE-family HTH domain
MGTGSTCSATRRLVGLSSPVAAGKRGSRVTHLRSAVPAHCFTPRSKALGIFDGEPNMEAEEAKRLRKASGLSQAAFGAALGLSRGTISRLERGSEALDRRTELAMRYVAEGRLQRTPELSEIHEAVSQLLDQTARRGIPPYDYVERLGAASRQWQMQRDEPAVEALLQRIEDSLATLNMVIAEDASPKRPTKIVRELELAWRTASPEKTRPSRSKISASGRRT